MARSSGGTRGEVPRVGRVSDSEIEIVDVSRGGQWSQVVLMQASSAAEASAGAADLHRVGVEVRYVGVVSADLGGEAGPILAALQPGLQEIVCFDSSTDPLVSGLDFSFAALDELGFGQDLVFTVPTLEGAVDHAVDTLLSPRHGTWEGRFVVVVGPPDVIVRARRHLTAPG